MSVCLAGPCDVTPATAEPIGLGLLGHAGMVAVPVAGLRSPVRTGFGEDTATALVAAGGDPIRTGDLVVFCKPVAVAPAVVRRDGRVQAGGHPAEHARLGVAEDRLDALTGTPGVVDDIARSVTLQGKVKGVARRAMTPALAIRFTLLMTLLPHADATEVMAALLAAVDAEHHDHDYRAVRIGDLDACAIDGSLLRMPDTPTNRDAYGSTGTADDCAPYPQLRELRLSHTGTRATLAVVTGPCGAAKSGTRDKGEAEQKLLDTALRHAPQVFTPNRLWIMDRNFPGVPRLQRLLGTGSHVLVRLKAGITVTRTGHYLPDDSYPATITGGQATLTVRVIEYTVSLAGQPTPELFCLVTDLHDHIAYPARTLADAYHWWWTGSETCLKEAKSTLNGAGPSTGAMLRSASPHLVTQEHAAWVTTTELTRAAARAAAAIAIPAGKGRRAGHRVHPREISFTAARHAIVTTTRTGATTASLPTSLVTANRQHTLTALARHRVVVDRNRHRDRKTKARLGFPTAGPRLPTRTAPAEIST